MFTLKTTRSPNSECANKNRVYVNPSLNLLTKYVILDNKHTYCIEHNKDIEIGYIGLNQKQRIILQKAENENVNCKFNTNTMCDADYINMEILTFSKQQKIDCSEFASYIKSSLLNGIPIEICQEIQLLFNGSTYTLKVIDLSVNDTDDNIGIINHDTAIYFSTFKKELKLENQEASLVDQVQPELFKEKINLSDLGIGGLNEEFGQIFRRAFASRALPKKAIDKLGIKHVKGVLLHGPPGCGKCLGKNTPILMYDGTIKMVQDVQVGDKLMGDDSKERNVLSVTKGREKMYKIIHDDGTSYTVNESHIISLKHKISKQMKTDKKGFYVKHFDNTHLNYKIDKFIFSGHASETKYKTKDDAFNDANKLFKSLDIEDRIDINVLKYLKLPRDVRRSLYGYRVGVEFEKDETLADPYLIGLLLANNNKTDFNLITEEHNIIQNYLTTNFNDYYKLENDGNITFRNFIDLKEIPKEYKVNNTDARLRLLAGIIDLKGDTNKFNYRFSTTYETLANDIIFVCRSLGFKCSSNKVIDGTNAYYRIKFSPNDNVLPTLLKKNKLFKNSKNQLTMMIKIEKLDVDDYYGFEIDGNRRFLLGDFTVTHNTLIAKQIGKILNCKEPKIVAGPELLNKYVGESERAVRDLFNDAYEDVENKELHLIILDEIDSLCKQRGSSTSDTGIGDKIVNQFLTMIDGPKSLNNVLLIGMTNRKDILDEAIMRPGRLEVVIEIGLPNEQGRIDILNIHTKKIRENNCLTDDVDMTTIAKNTKNYTGAELEGLIRSATSYAISREINISENKIDMKKELNIKLTLDDFNKALNDIVPLFSKTSDEINELIATPFIEWNSSVTLLKDNLINKISKLKFGNITSELIYGFPYIGKTKFVAHVAKLSNIACVRMITPEKLLKVSDKSVYISNIFEQCSKAETSIIILDGFERIIEWSGIGPRFNNQILQTIMTILRAQIKRKNKMIILCTAYKYETLEMLEIAELFDETVEYPHIICKNDVNKYFPETYDTFEFLDDKINISEVFKILKTLD